VSPEERETRRKELEAKMADDNNNKDKGSGSEMSVLTDAVKACTDAIGAYGKRLDALEAAQAEQPNQNGDRLRGKGREDTGDDDINFDSLDDGEKDRLTENEQVGNDRPREVAADEARRRYDSAIAALPRWQRDEMLMGKNYAIQARLDSVCNEMGLGHATKPFPGEKPTTFLARALVPLKRYSERYRSVSLTGMSRAQLKVAADDIVADCLREAKKPTPVPGVLRQIVKRTESGATENTYVGEPISWMAAFSTPGGARSYVRKFNTPQSGWRQ
jgi:hypothetical protein